MNTLWFFRVHLRGARRVHRVAAPHFYCQSRTSSGPWTGSDKMADKRSKEKKKKDTALDAAVKVGEPASISHRQKKTHPSPSGTASSSKDTGGPPLKKFFSTQPWGRKQHREIPDYSKMPLEEKRQHYSCGDKYLELANLPTWEESHRTVPYPKSLEGSKYSVDSDLNKKVSLWRGDITRLEIDAIVNAANSSLLGGGGVDGAIHQAAGSSLRRECEGLGGCSTGDAKLTGGHRLPAKYILHTVGPMNRRKEKLQSCYDRCLELVLKHKIQSVAFPCIATGIYGYPNEAAAHLALDTVRRWLGDHRKKVDRIIFCVFLKTDHNIYSSLLHYYFPVESPVDSSEEQSSGEELDGIYIAYTPEVEKKSEKPPALKWSLSAPASTAHHTEEPERRDQEPEHKTSSEQQAGVVPEETTATEENMEEGDKRTTLDSTSAKTPGQTGGVSGVADDTTVTEEKMEEGNKGTGVDQTSTSGPKTVQQTGVVPGAGDTTVTEEKVKTPEQAGGVSHMAEDTTATGEIMEEDRETGHSPSEPGGDK